MKSKILQLISILFIQKSFAQNNAVDRGFSSVGFANVVSSLNDIDELYGFALDSKSIPYGVEASFSFKLDGHWAFDAAVDLRSRSSEKIISDCPVGMPPDFGALTFKKQYIDLPIMIQYHLLNKSKLKFSLTAGFKNTLRIQNSEFYNSSDELTNSISAKYCIAFSGGIKETIPLTARLKLAASQLGNVYLGNKFDLSGLDFKLGLEFNL